MRESALPSRINQARVVSDILDLARRENFRVNLFEAYDESWKRELEGTVGGSWGLFDGERRALKYPPGIPISNSPWWKLQMAAGMALALLVFGAAWWGYRRKPVERCLASWIAVGASATTAGSLLGVAAQRAFYESVGAGGWVLSGVFLLAASASPVLGAGSLMAGRTLPSSLQLLGPRRVRTSSVSAAALGLALMVIAVVGTETAIALVFDPRNIEFPFASLTMATMPFAAIALLNPSRSGSRPLTESMFAGIFAVAAVYVAFNEGPANWQSLWTCGAYMLLAMTLWRVRTPD